MIRRQNVKRAGCLDPGEARPVKARAAISKVKTMLIVFFDSRGISYSEFVPSGQMRWADYSNACGE